MMQRVEKVNKVAWEAAASSAAKSTALGSNKSE
jgi:hypothetical protein